MRRTSMTRSREYRSWRDWLGGQDLVRIAGVRAVSRDRERQAIVAALWQALPPGFLRNLANREQGG